jgi:hypothetical protein
MTYRRVETTRLSIRAIRDEIGERLRFLVARKPLLLSLRLLVLMQRLKKADR